MHLRLTRALAKISCSHKRGRRRRLHRDAAAQGLHLAPFDATREGKGSEVESFHANKSLFSFIRSPKLNEEGKASRLPAASLPLLPLFVIAVSLTILQRPFVLCK